MLLTPDLHQVQISRPKLSAYLRGNCLLFCCSTTSIYSLLESPASLAALYNPNDVDQGNDEQTSKVGKLVYILNPKLITYMKLNWD